MKKISIISVYNNELLLNKLIDTINSQIGVSVDKVIIDNTKNKFSSAASALNYGIKKTCGEVLVFVHQDVEFLSTDSLVKIYDFADENRFTVFGAAGVKSKDKGHSDGILSAMYEGEFKSKYTSLSCPTECFVLDECLIACHRDCMNYLSFDEKVCDGWHLYGADLCMQAQINPNLNVVVLPMDYVWHKSHGNADKSYFQTQGKLAKKYKDYYKIINTTNGFQYTNSFKRILLNIYRKLRYRI